MGDEQQRARIGRERRLELLDGRQVQVIGRLVEHQQVDAAGLQQGQRGAGPLTGGEGARRPQHVRGPEAELRQQRPDVSRRHARDGGREGVQQWLAAQEQAACLVHLADDHAGAQRRVPRIERYPPEQRLQQGRLAGTVRAGDRDPVRPVDLQVNRPQGEGAAADDGAAHRGDDRSRPRRRGDLHPQVPFLARLLDSLQALDEPLGLPGLRRLLLGRLGAELPPDLVVVGLLAPGVLDALLHPGPLGMGPILQGRDRAGVLFVLRAGVPSRHVPFVQICRIASAVGPDLLLGQVEFDDPGHGPGEELPVVADQDGPGAQALDECLQPGEPVEVQVVGRLVQQEHVVAAEQQRGQRRPRRLAAGQDGHELIELHGQAQAGHDRIGPLVQVCAAERQPPLQPARVAVIRSGPSGGQRVRGGLHRVVRRGDAGAPGQELPDGLARAPIRLLRQIADRRLRRADRHRTGVRAGFAREQAQQGGLARAVRADQADDITGAGHQVQTRE